VENRDRWLAQRECRLNDPLRVVTATERQCTTFFGVAFCNPTEECFSDVEIRFTLMKLVNGIVDLWPGSDNIVTEAYVVAGPLVGEQRYAPEVRDMLTGAVVRFFFDGVDSASTISLRMRVCIPCGIVFSEQEISLRALVTFHDDSGALPVAFVAQEWLDIWQAPQVDIPLFPRARGEAEEKVVPMDYRQREFHCGCT
jgi:hypothetical protein